MKKLLFKILLLTFIFQIIQSQQKLSHCQNGNRTVLLGSNQNLQLKCIECPEGEYTYYNENDKNLECRNCDSGLSNYKNDIVINNFLSQDLLFRYSFISSCSLKSDLCPKWKQDYFSIKVNYIQSLSYISFFILDQYFMNDGELIIKYINYNGGIDKSFNIYINGKLILTDDTDNNNLKIKSFKVKKGENIFNFEYAVNEEMKIKNKNINNNESFIEIFEIQFKNAEISALNCDKYSSIDKLSYNILDECEYDVNKCKEDDNCTFRFYSEIKKDYCIQQLDSFYQEVEYQKIKDAKCMELSTLPNKTILCEYCSFGEYTKINGNKKTCHYCENNNYNPKEINEENSCESICKEENNKQPVKVFYYKNFENPSNLKIEKIEIIQPKGTALIAYKKYNEKQNTIFYIEINSNYTVKLINPKDEGTNLDYYTFTIPFTYGNHSLYIKGSNLKVDKVLIKGSKEGGNYKCIDKVNINEEIKCQKNNEFYSSLQNKCLNCPLGTTIDKNGNCELYNQFINGIYTFDNNNINVDLFSNNYELENQNITYYLKINPTNPLIYMKNKTSNDTNDNIDIIGSELKKIKLVKGMNNRGMILFFISGKDKSFIYIKCNPKITEDMKPQIYLKNITVDNDNVTNYFFMIESNTSCPYCLTSEVTFDENSSSECIKGIKKINVSYDNNTLCLIKPFDDKEILQLKDDNNLLLDKKTQDIEEQLIINIFEINEDIPVKYEKENDEIIVSFEKGVKCEDNKDDKSQLTIVLAIFFCFVILIVLGLAGVLIWKMVDNKMKANKRKNEKEKMSELSIISVNK